MLKTILPLEARFLAADLRPISIGIATILTSLAVAHPVDYYMSHHFSGITTYPYGWLNNPGVLATVLTSTILCLPLFPLANSAHPFRAFLYFCGLGFFVWFTQTCIVGVREFAPYHFFIYGSRIREPLFFLTSTLPYILFGTYSAALRYIFPSHSIGEPALNGFRPYVALNATFFVLLSLVALLAVTHYSFWHDHDQWLYWLEASEHISFPADIFVGVILSMAAICFVHSLPLLVAGAVYVAVVLTPVGLKALGSDYFHHAPGPEDLALILLASALYGILLVLTRRRVEPAANAAEDAPAL